MKTCVFAGTFDPPTKGHLEVINKALEIFDHVIVGVLVNPDKTPLFTDKERKVLLEKMLEEVPNTEVVVYGGMLVDLLKANDTNFYVRGVRNELDYKYEIAMNYYNQQMYKDINTIFIPTSKELAFVSSSTIRELIIKKEDFSDYVPENIYEDIKKMALKK
ncbi:MAG: pantetheine-phosphate adenylyltransferase [Clostridiales bacterium]|nr:pantetheine-phosphate adenylyltransferase [Clostridiales bacterium]